MRPCTTELTHTHWGRQGQNEPFCSSVTLHTGHMPCSPHRSYRVATSCPKGMYIANLGTLSETLWHYLLSMARRIVGRVSQWHVSSCLQFHSLASIPGCVQWSIGKPYLDHVALGLTHLAVRYYPLAFPQLTEMIVL